MSRSIAAPRGVSTQRTLSRGYIGISYRFRLIQVLTTRGHRDASYLQHTNHSSLRTIARFQQNFGWITYGTIWVVPKASIPAGCVLFYLLNDMQKWTAAHPWNSVDTFSFLRDNRSSIVARWGQTIISMYGIRELHGLDRTTYVTHRPAPLPGYCAFTTSASSWPLLVPPEAPSRPKPHHDRLF